MSDEKKKINNVSSVEQLVCLADLKRGDILRNKQSGNSCVIDTIIGLPHGKLCVIGIRTQHISNPSEWEIVKYEREAVGDNS